MAPPPSQNSLYRERSWLEFNRRVLNEAMDPRTPLLERVRFLDIFASNLDEFFMKRVGGLKRKVRANVETALADGKAPQEKLAEIRKLSLSLIDERVKCFTGFIRPELEAQGIKLLNWEALASDELEEVNRYFAEKVFPVLTPLSVDPGHPFPFISHLSTSIGVLMKVSEDEEEIFARIKVPSFFPAWVRLHASRNSSEIRFVSLYEIIVRNLSLLFPGMKIVDVMLFRVTRNADIEKGDDDAEDLLAMVAEELRERRFAEVVRLEHAPNPNPKMMKILTEELEVGPDDIYELPLNLEFFTLSQIAELNIVSLKYPSFAPVPPPAMSDEDANIFEVIRQNDVLVHHPYESFSLSVERFIRTAVDDPKVMAIKMTLYRTGEDSPFIPLLIRAAESGKQVACLVELKARLDEERNIFLARALEKAGVHVVYGMVGLKTHCKIALVVRQENEGVQSYVHLGTGNYHSKTARLYTDIGLFTAKKDFTNDVVHLFHYLTGRSLQWKFRKLLVAPIDMRESFLRMIQRERDNAKKGLPAHMIIKVNNLDDTEITNALYEASNDGVKIDLIVRSICCVVPGVPGFSESIRVISVVGRFLEHSRLFYFRNGAESPSMGEIFIGSADWMYRNLNQRVEAVCPIEEPVLKTRIWEILNLFINDERQGWDMLSSGGYVQRVPSDGKSTGAQDILIQSALTRDRDRLYQARQTAERATSHLFS